MFLLAESELVFVWRNATPEAKAIIVILVIFSIFAWSVMAQKAMQMRRAKRLNTFFESEFRTQKHVLDVYDRKLQVPDCPLFVVYQEGCKELDARLKERGSNERRRYVSLKGMEHVKRTLERTVAQQSLKLESGLILLAIAVSGAPFLGLLGTVWGVMSTFSYVALKGSADLKTMAPGVSAALVTTVAGSARRHSVHVRLQLARAQSPRPDGRSGQLRPGTHLPHGDGVFARRGRCREVRTMRRFSQRNSLVTLSDINITPLLDLAFVLLIIFIITTPLLEQGLNLKLPQGGQADSPKINPRDIRTVDISARGDYKFRERFYSVDQIATTLRDEQRRNPNLIVYVRADEEGAWKHIAALLNRFEQVGVVNISMRTDPTTAPRRSR
jgi:biopolymer transport protein TolQ